MITCAIFQGPLPLPFRPLPIPKKRNFYTNDLSPKLTSPVRSVPPFENTISLINCPVRHEASRSLFPVLSFLDLSEFAPFSFFYFYSFFLLSRLPRVSSFTRGSAGLSRVRLFPSPVNLFVLASFLLSFYPTHDFLQRRKAVEAFFRLLPFPLFFFFPVFDLLSLLCHRRYPVS